VPAKGPQRLCWRRSGSWRASGRCETQSEHVR
jgi:hypothetical protein